MMNGGSVKGDSFNIICECTPYVAKIMADGLGMGGVGIMRLRIFEGLTTSEELIEAFKSQESDILNLHSKRKDLTCWCIKESEYLKIMGTLIGVEVLK